MFELINLGYIIGRILVAIALIAVPLSMSHASMGSTNNSAHSMHQMSFSMSGNSNHVMKHNLTKEQASHNDNSSQNHDTTDCCSSTCGGALMIEFQSCEAWPVYSPVRIGFERPLTPGEMVSLDRPPNI